MGVKTYDVIVIGSGASGFSAAAEASRRGASVCVVERDAWGGECPNYACVPTKALLKSAKQYYQAKKRLQEYGVYAKSVTYNFSKIMARKEDVVHTITGGGDRILQSAKDSGIETISGDAEFVDEHTLKVGSKKIRGDRIVIASGTVDVIPPIDGLEEAGYLTYKDAVALKRKPSSIVIVGGGPVGCEFATFFGMLETHVTLIQISPVLLDKEDEEISALAQKQLEELGVNVFTNAKALSVERQGAKRMVVFQEGDKKRQSVVVDRVLIAAGKRANIKGLKLENAGVKMDSKGRLDLDKYLRTSKNHIFAAGDVAGGLLFTHTAHAEGSIVGKNVMQKTARSMDTRDLKVIPRVTFLSPEIASVGMTPKEAKEKKKNVLIDRFPVGALGRAVTESERTGLVKLVVDEKTRTILGGHIVSDRAGEMIHEVALAMYKKIKIDDVAGMIHAYPTFSEAIAAAAGSV